MSDDRRFFVTARRALLMILAETERALDMEPTTAELKRLREELRRKQRDDEASPTNPR